ncbi:unnamed protein product [Toxocara canis]|uniref:Submaxillary mucin-like protein n=1 Tax=Toxocara canis TaxID=6265 RepID=A0A183V0S3_TOXCA|nr:unnamed protein product [Toxocara canis]
MELQYSRETTATMIIFAQETVAHLMRNFLEPGQLVVRTNRFEMKQRCVLLKKERRTCHCGILNIPPIGILNITCDEAHSCNGSFCVTERGPYPHSYCGTDWDPMVEGCVSRPGEDEICTCMQDFCNFPYPEANGSTTTAGPTTTSAAITAPTATETTTVTITATQPPTTTSAPDLTTSTAPGATTTTVATTATEVPTTTSAPNMTTSTAPGGTTTAINTTATGALTTTSAPSMTTSTASGATTTTVASTATGVLTTTSAANLTTSTAPGATTITVTTAAA